MLSGDVADHGLASEYAAARAWLDRWRGPVAVCPGNHDVRTAFVEGLGVPARSVVETGGYRFLMLDSLVDAVAGVRTDKGRLGEEQLGWLDRALGASGDPAFVCLHHPPTTIGVPLMDPIRLMDANALAAVIDHHPHVVATLVGHAHTMCVTTYAGRPLLIGGGVVSAVPLEAEPYPTVWYDAPASLRAPPRRRRPPRDHPLARPRRSVILSASVISGACSSPSTRHAVRDRRPPRR